MNREALIEALADKEHASWARWMDYLFSKCLEVPTPDGRNTEMVIPMGLVERWKRQVVTPYADLSEQEKESDRKEVAHILPIIEAYQQEQLQQIIANAEKALAETAKAIESDWPSILADGLESIITLCKEQLTKG